MTLTFSFLTLKPSKRYELEGFDSGPDPAAFILSIPGEMRGVVGQGDYVWRSLLPQLLGAPGACTFLRIGMQADTVIVALGHICCGKYRTMSSAAFPSVSVNCPGVQS